MERDALVVGAGPNGLSAAITLARAGLSVTVREAKEKAGGLVACAGFTLPGFIHDVGSAVFPMVGSTGFLSRLPLRGHGLNLIFPEASVAHPLDDGRAVLVWRDMRRTCIGLGRDGPAYSRLVGDLVDSWDDISADILSPLGRPRRPVAFLRFVWKALVPAALFARITFKTYEARSAFAGLCAHGIIPLSHPASTAFGLVMAATCHRNGWPVVEGGSARLADALVSILLGMGGRVITSSAVEDPADIEGCDAVFFDLWPHHAVRIAGRAVSPWYRKAIAGYRSGPGVFKVDWALSGAIPWRARECSLAATVHVGGGIEEISQAEGEVWRGIPPERPFVFLVQPSLFDPSRCPEGRHTAWAYCHVPAGCSFDMTQRIEDQVERFAPGFKGLILERHVMTPEDLEAFDANCVGGDIAGGANTLSQLLARPLPFVKPYVMGGKGLYLCSASTPPGGGVHGLCGHYAALAYLRSKGSSPRGDHGEDG